MFKQLRDQFETNLSHLKGLVVNETLFERLIAHQPIRVRILNRYAPGTLMLVKCGFVAPEVAEVIFTEQVDPGQGCLPPVYYSVLMFTRRSFDEVRRARPTPLACEACDPPLAELE